MGIQGATTTVLVTGNTHPGDSLRGQRTLRWIDAGVEKVGGGREGEGSGIREHGEAEARRLLDAALDYLVLASDDLAMMSKGDPQKLAVAAFVRKRTAVTNQWLASALRMGDASRVSHALRCGTAAKLVKKLETSLL